MPLRGRSDQTASHVDNQPPSASDQTRSSADSVCLRYADWLRGSSYCYQPTIHGTARDQPAPQPSTWRFRLETGR